MARKRVAQTRNLIRLSVAYAKVCQRLPGDPKVILCHGDPGLGKTTAGCEVFLENQGVLITALPGSTQKSLVDKLLFELGAGEPARATAKATEQLINCLNERPRPIFVDELDQLLYNTRALETLRIVHDLTACPLILIGMTGVERSIMRLRQLSSRITERVEFLPSDFDDVRLVANAVSDVAIEDDLLEQLFNASKGNLREVKVGLATIQSFARGKRLERIGLSQWDGRTFFFRDAISK